MKLATYNDGSRDGQLVVVSRDLSQAHYANGIATRLQQVLDDWGFVSPQLEELSIQLDHGKLRHAFNFEPKQCLAPLPRAGSWVRGRQPEALRRAAGDVFLGPCEPARFASEAMGIDFGAGLAVVTGDVAQGASPAQALEGVRLLLLVNDWTLQQVGDGEPMAAFGPVAVTPDELGPAWRGGRVDGSLQAQWNGRKVGQCEAGATTGADFGQLIAHLARTRPVRAGALIGAGTPVAGDGVAGYACIADKRALEGESPKTEFMKFGDSIRIEMKGRDGLSVFGAIDQDVVALHEEKSP